MEAGIQDAPFFPAEFTLGLGNFFKSAFKFGKFAMAGGKNIFTKDLLSTSKVIAKGSAIRDVGRLVKEHGGRAKEWSKKKGWDRKGQEWHWYERQGQKYEIKLKE